eukprot:MONOS_15778.1-p1 / transcript=MONOS_15778.1 / gene=MONOS_15778 / organism=Monocercomonoides_exilis_PA203 / gene_product=unspecified product / transcript_product=unspecified product / location=Mono_scaffold01353:4748-6328(-) / protein_length=499 / sequence_SO=supercontig / SO=protein_coding / is_pseudo=false
MGWKCVFCQSEEDAHEREGEGQSDHSPKDQSSNLKDSSATLERVTSPENKGSKKKKSKLNKQSKNISGWKLKKNTKSSLKKKKEKYEDLDEEELAALLEPSTESTDDKNDSDAVISESGDEEDEYYEDSINKGEEEEDEEEAYDDKRHPNSDETSDDDEEFYEGKYSRRRKKVNAAARKHAQQLEEMKKKIEQMNAKYEPQLSGSSTAEQMVKRRGASDKPAQTPKAKSSRVVLVDERERLLPVFGQQKIANRKTAKKSFGKTFNHAAVESGEFESYFDEEGKRTQKGKNEAKKSFRMKYHNTRHSSHEYGASQIQQLQLQQMKDKEDDSKTQTESESSKDKAIESFKSKEISSSLAPQAKLVDSEENEMHSLQETLKLLRKRSARNHRRINGTLMPRKIHHHRQSETETENEESVKLESSTMKREDGEENLSKMEKNEKEGRKDIFSHPLTYATNIASEQLHCSEKIRNTELLSSKELSLLESVVYVLYGKTISEAG